MKILIVNCFYWPDLAGGAERSVKRLADLHSKAGHEISVLTTHAGPNIQLDEVDGVKVYRLPPHNLYWAKQADQPVGWQRAIWHAIDSYNIQSYRDARTVIRELQPDLISCHNLPGLSASIWSAGRNLGIPVVQVLRDYYTLCPRSTMYRAGHNCKSICNSCKIFRINHANLSNSLSAVVGCSKAVLEKHLKFGIYQNVPIKRVIHNAEHINPENKNKTTSGDQLTFGYIGALTEVKGIHDMLNAFQAAQTKSKRRLNILLAGTGQEGYVQELKEEFSHPAIHFVGHSDPTSFFPKTDVAIVPSVWDDPLPGVAFQALAYGIPVLGAMRGGIIEIVQNNKNGLLYDPDEPDGLLSAMIRIINDQELLDTLTRNASESAKPFLDEDRMFTEYMSLYDDVLRPFMTSRS